MVVAVYLSLKFLAVEGWLSKEFLFSQLQENTNRQIIPQCFYLQKNKNNRSLSQETLKFCSTIKDSLQVKCSESCLTQLLFKVDPYRLAKWKYLQRISAKTKNT